MHKTTAILLTLTALTSPVYADESSDIQAIKNEVEWHAQFQPHAAQPTTPAYAYSYTPPIQRNDNADLFGALGGLLLVGLGVWFCVRKK